MSKNMKRNSLDYILTDCLPNEISIRYTHIHLYNYIMNNKPINDKLLLSVQETKNQYIEGKELFKGSTTVPLRYGVLKNNGDYRTISLMSPLSSLNAFLFIDLYQNNILNNLSQSRFSIRKATKNNKLFHMHSIKRVTTYYSGKKKSHKIIEQRGDYFTIAPHQSLVDFKSSSQWFNDSSRFSYLASFDFAKCFDSIYSHSYKWFITSNLVDSINFNNSHLFKTLDNICQNINGKQTNGIIVGSEFSRLLAELLLQQIDELVFHELNNEGLIYDQDYRLYRYVDDFYLFTDSESAIKKIMGIIQTKSRQFNLTLNDNKTNIQKLPIVQNNWFSEIEILKAKINEVFETDEFHKNIYNKHSLNKRFSNLKAHYLNLIGKNRDKQQTITRYTLSIFDKKFKLKKEEMDTFDEMPEKRLCEYIDFIFFIHQFDVSFNSNARLISILNSINKFHSLVGSDNVQRIINKSFQSLELDDYSDFQNLLLIFNQLRFRFPPNFESKMVADILESDNPMLIANLYNYCEGTAIKEVHENQINKLISEKLSNIILTKKALYYSEFWYIIVFYNFPHLDKNNHIRMKEIINDSMINYNPNTSTKYLYNIIGKFIKENKMGFYFWGEMDALTEISFKTENLSLFRRDY